MGGIRIESYNTIHSSRGFRCALPLFHVEQVSLWPAATRKRVILTPVDRSLVRQFSPGGKDDMNQSHAPFSHLIRSPEGSDGAGAAPKSAAKKSAPMSRLGRGLGALIPAAAPKSSPVTPPPSPSTSPANAPVGGDASSHPPGATKAQSITSTSAAPSASAYRDPTGVGVQAPQAVTAEPKMASSASGASTAPKGSNSPSPRAGTPTTESVEARATDLPAGDGISGVPSQGVATSPKSSPTAAAAAASAAERSTWNTTSDQSVINIPIARIQRNPRQPREKFDDAALRALA